MPDAPAPTRTDQRGTQRRDPDAAARRDRSTASSSWAGRGRPRPRSSRRAGVSRGAQVHHYPTKDDLVLAAVEHLLDRRIEEFRQAFAAPPARPALAGGRDAAAVRAVLRVDRSTPGSSSSSRRAPNRRCTRASSSSRRASSRTRSRRSGRCSPTRRADHALAARRAVRFAFSVLDGLALGRHPRRIRAATATPCSTPSTSSSLRTFPHPRRSIMTSGITLDDEQRADAVHRSRATAVAAVGREALRRLRRRRVGRRGIPHRSRRPALGARARHRSRRDRVVPKPAARAAGAHRACTASPRT